MGSTGACGIIPGTCGGVCNSTAGAGVPWAPRGALAAALPFGSRSWVSHGAPPRFVIAASRHAARCSPRGSGQGWGVAWLCLGSREAVSSQPRWLDAHSHSYLPACLLLFLLRMISLHGYSYAASQMRRIRRGIETARPRSWNAADRETLSSMVRPMHWPGVRISHEDGVQGVSQLCDTIAQPPSRRSGRRGTSALDLILNELVP